jgi:hypothetical protein
MWRTLLILRSVLSLRLESQSSLELIPYKDSRLPFLSNIDYNRLYCFDPTSSTPGVSLLSTERTKSSTVISCKVSADCPAGTPFCLGSICRECRYPSDCPAATAFLWSRNFCSIDTNYACSECGTDSDCPSNTICRGVFDAYGVDRKRCVTCDPDAIPSDAVMKSTGTCEWFCQDPADMVGPDGKCTPCPKCLDGQMLIPTEDFALSIPRSFFPSCTMANNPRCVDCPAKNNPCANLLSPTTNWAGTPGVGQLPSQYACGTFQCKPDWWLDTSINQCRKCDYRSCPSGQQLVGCGVASAGICEPCPGPGPFINPLDLTYSVTISSDVCKPQCLSNQALVRTNATTPWICQVCSGNEACPPGYLFSGCGGPNPGQCLQCAPVPPPGSYWTGPGCSVSVCDPSICAPGQKLVGCGGTSAGLCQACPVPLPPNAVSYTTVYEEQSLTRDTCGIACASGYFSRRSSDGTTYECVRCDPSICPTSQTLVGCGGDQPGTCVSCPIPNPGLYIVGPGCATAQCPAGPSVCPAGEQYTGCGGTSPGACASCGSLPVGASSWVQSTSCDFNCNSGYYTNVTFGVKTCESCSSLAVSSCAIGQVLNGCSSTSPGICQSCPAINATTYWTGAQDCQTGSCSNRGCAPDAIAQGCGLAIAGTCTSCSIINPILPSFATGWVAIDNQCTPGCQSGAYRTPAGTCQLCDLTRCADGYVLSGCGGTDMGQCVQCTNSLDNGQCYSSHGVRLGDTGSCPAGPCPVFI